MRTNISFLGFIVAVQNGKTQAENAFNNLNREGALENIKEICPLFFRYLNNTYQKPAKLVIPGEGNNYEVILSEEGTTQGDVAAMALYGLGIKPLTESKP